MVILAIFVILEASKYITSFICLLFVFFCCSKQKVANFEQTVTGHDAKTNAEIFRLICCIDCRSYCFPLAAPYLEQLSC